MLKYISLFVFLVIIVSCEDKYADSNDISTTTIDNQSSTVIEHTSYGNDDGEGMLEYSYKDSSFYASLSKVSVFQSSVKKGIANYLLAHLKTVKTLRLIGVTHRYDIKQSKSSYYIQYYKNGNTDKKWGCKLNFANGNFRIANQNINVEKDKDFQLLYSNALDVETLNQIKSIH